jgi:hypothetical protein
VVLSRVGYSDRLKTGERGRDSVCHDLFSFRR